MSTRLFDKGRQGFLDGSLDWDTNSFKAIQLLLDGSLTDVAIKQVTAATNASPINVTVTAHGFANGDIVVIRGAVGNTAANGTWQVSGQTTNAFNLVTVKDSLNSTGNGAFSGTACVVDLTLAQNLSDIDGARVSTDSSALTTPTVTNGVADVDDIAFTSVLGTVHGIAIYRDTGVAATSRLAYFTDGRSQVIVSADAASSATTVWVEQLEGVIPNGTAIVFSNGVTATLTAQANANARSLTVSALSGAISAGHQGDVQTQNSGLPISLTNGNWTALLDNTANRLFKL